MKKEINIKKGDILSLPKDYKRTKLGVIPIDWSVVTLDSIGEFSKGKGIKKTEVITEGEGFPCIRYAEIYTKYDNYTTELNSKIDASTIVLTNKIQKGDLLFAGSGETLEDIGKCVAYLGEEVAYAGGDIIILKNEKQSSKYLGLLLNNDIVKRQTYKLGQGHSVVHIYASGLKKLQIPLPPKPQQIKIANILCTWDTAINQQKQLIQAKQKQKKGLMQLLLTGKKRFDGFTEAWEEVRLGEIADITTGKLDANAMVLNGKYRFYTCAKNYYRINVFKFDTEALLISGNGANVGYIHHYKGKFNAYQRTYVLYNVKSNYEFVKYFLNQFLKRRIQSEKKEGNTPYIVLSTLSQMKMKIPTPKEQQKIAKY